MDDDSAGKINRFEGGPFVRQSREMTRAAPHCVGNRVVHGKSPEGGVKKHCGELHAFRHCADDEGGGDCGEHCLKQREGPRKNPRLIRAGLHADSFEAKEFSAAEDVLQNRTVGAETFTEDEAEAKAPPHKNAQSRQGETLGCDGEYVAGADESAIEEEQPGDAHQEDEGRADEDPDIIARLDGRGG